MQQQQVTTQRTILLVEDDDETRGLYRVMLQHGGFRVVEAANGPDAVRCALEESPDLILMDLNLPLLDGWEAARRIRSSANVGSTPLLAFSAMVDSTADLRQDSTFFDGFIAKPVAAGDLVRRVAAYVDLLAPAPTKTTEPSRPSRARHAPSDRVAQAGTAWQ